MKGLSELYLMEVEVPNKECNQVWFQQKQARYFGPISVSLGTTFLREYVSYDISETVFMYGAY